ncbi:MAG: acyl-protein synthetase [Candidatus Riflebacteria bacterium]|nr:acyl-protein synthetase [Candidatus Riflebacteria bacterium]
MDPIDRLFRHDPFDYSQTGKNLLVAASRQAFIHHYDGCQQYRRLCDLVGVTPRDVSRWTDLGRIPHVFVGTLKERDLLSVPRSRVVREFTSSGTGGRQSRICLDKGSFDRVVLSARNIHDRLGMVSPEQEVNYLCFSYDPSRASELGTSFTDDLLTSFTGKREVFYTIRWDDSRGDFSFDKEGTRTRLETFQAQPHPVRLLGFPAFIYLFLQEAVAARGAPYSLGPMSWVMTGGGWKTLADQAVSKDTFISDVSTWLSIPRENVRDMYGMVEHGIPYVDCSRHRLHVPIYARVFVRDPETMRELGPGEVGLLQFQTPYITSYPSHSLLTTDLGTWEPSCPCGLPGPLVKILGRGGVKKHKGCAITAAEAFL